jgi:hypothetical protein
MRPAKSPQALRSHSETFFSKSRFVISRNGQSSLYQASAVPGHSPLNPTERQFCSHQKVYAMRALLLCPQSAIQAADRGRPIQAVRAAFIREVNIQSGLKDYYKALSTRQTPVSRIDFFGPLPDGGRHDLILDDDALLGSPKHFIIGQDPRLRGFCIPGRALIVGCPDHEGRPTKATMSLKGAHEMFHYADHGAIPEPPGLVTEKGSQTTTSFDFQPFTQSPLRRSFRRGQKGIPLNKHTVFSDSIGAAIAEAQEDYVHDLCCAVELISELGQATSRAAIILFDEKNPDFDFRVLASDQSPSYAIPRVYRTQPTQRATLST